jgi:parallel beta-helix repeat protein
VKDSRLDTSPFGSGIALISCKGVNLTSNEIARNAYYGIDIQESKDITITGNLLENNDRSAVMLEYLFKGCENADVRNNIIRYNNGYAVESYAGRNIKVGSNSFEGNNSEKPALISEEKKMIMQ